MASQSGALPNRSKSNQPPKSFRSFDIPKPQLQFDTPPSNYTDTFKPLLTAKPHALLPLAESLVPIKVEDGTLQYPHPYKTEIERYSYPDWVFRPADPITSTPFTETTATFVDSPEAVEQMLAELREEKVIALDLEHHDYRTYNGLLSLMQISTRKKDWIVDTLQPWRLQLQRLNEVFADPGIVKVFHGAMMDIIWLQRDLGLYIVGLFDTGHAARALGYPAASLAYLLQRFVNFDAQKQYQMADWRIRPLPQEMFDYARSDTHFLLYIFDCIRNELLSSPAAPVAPDSPETRSLISIVARKSQETSLQTFVHQPYDDATGQGSIGWYRMLTRTPVMLSPQQFEVFRSLHSWRDRLARENDESIQYVMPNHVLFSVSKSLPVDKPGILSLFPHPTPLVRSHLGSIIEVIKQAKVKGEAGPTMMRVLEDIGHKFKPVVRPGMGIADTVKMLKSEAKKDTRAAPSVAPSQSLPHSKTSRFPNVDLARKPVLRNSLSTFWGGALAPSSPPLTSCQRAAGLSTSASDISLPIPLPNLTALVFEQDQSSEPSPSTEKPPHSFVPADQRKLVPVDDFFVVRQLGMSKGKKSKPESSSADTDSGTSGDPSESSSQEDVEMSDLPDGHVSSSPTPAAATPRPTVLAKKSKKGVEPKVKKSKDRSKKEKKAATKADNSTPKSPAAPFDYSAAPSVLNGHDTSAKGRTRKLDPFKRAMEGPRAERKRHREGAGKSGSWAR